MNRRGRSRGVVAVLALGMALLTACSAPVSQVAPSVSAETVSPDLVPFYSQALTWKACAAGFTCARVRVPLDWAHPSGKAISLSLIRHAAAKEKRLGSLFVNPGGPGASGVRFVRESFDRAVDSTLAASFDVIGFDPRGVGESTPITCVDSPAQMDALLYGITPGKRGSASWRQANARETKAFGQACLARTGDLLGHVDSLSVARDLDVMRALVGDPTLNYIGYSYGTFIGGMYAQTFPEHVGRLVLDGAVDPSVSSDDSLVAQARGFDMALGNWIAWCVKQNDCPFTGSVTSAQRAIAGILSKLDARPEAGSDGRKVGADTFATAIITPLYSPDSWKYLTQLFADYYSGNIDTALTLADWYNERADGGTYLSNQTEAFVAVSCLDTPASAPGDVEHTATRLAAAAPVLGPYFAWGDSCAQWPERPVIAATKLGPTGPQPIVVIGTTGDPATPIEWARGFAAQLEDGRLITYRGEGHAGYNRGSKCVDALVDEFLIAHTAPAASVTC